jgi:superoxide reductase
MAAERYQVYKCEVCGIVTVILEGGAGEPFCCGRPMSLLPERTADAGKEKHVPVVEDDGEELLVKVGSIEHPMEAKHYIQWIELIGESGVCRRELAPGQKPQARFPSGGGARQIRCYCNLHGLWKA